MARVTREQEKPTKCPMYTEKKKKKGWQQQRLKDGTNCTEAL